jgi:hypothetical protein
MGTGVYYTVGSNKKATIEFSHHFLGRELSRINRDLN